MATTITPGDRQYLSVLHRQLKRGDAVKCHPSWVLKALDGLEATEIRAEKAERERDALAQKFAEVSDKMSGHNPPRSISHACDVCPAGSDIEMEGVTCEVRLLEWASQQTTCAL